MDCPSYSWHSSQLTLDAMFHILAVKCQLSFLAGWSRGGITGSYTAIPRELIFISLPGLFHVNEAATARAGRQMAYERSRSGDYVHSPTCPIVCKFKQQLEKLIATPWHLSGTSVLSSHTEVPRPFSTPVSSYPASSQSERWNRDTLISCPTQQHNSYCVPGAVAGGRNRHRG